MLVVLLRQDSALVSLRCFGGMLLWHLPRRQELMLQAGLLQLQPPGVAPLWLLRSGLRSVVQGKEGPRAGGRGSQREGHAKARAVPRAVRESLSGQKQNASNLITPAPTLTLILTLTQSNPNRNPNPNIL